MLVYRTTCFAYGELENLKLGYMTPQQRRVDDDHFLSGAPSKVNSFGQYQCDQTKYFYFFAEDAYTIYSSYNNDVMNKLYCKKYETFEYDIPLELLIPYIGMGTYRHCLNHPVLEFAIPYTVLQEYYEPDLKDYSTEKLSLRNQRMLYNGVKGSLNGDCFNSLSNIFKISCLTGIVFSPIDKIPLSSRKSGYERYILGEYKRFLEVLNIVYNEQGKTTFPGFLKDPVFVVPNNNKYDMSEVEVLLNEMMYDYSLIK